MRAWSGLSDFEVGLGAVAVVRQRESLIVRAREQQERVKAPKVKPCKRQEQARDDERDAPGAAFEEGKGQGEEDETANE